VLTALVNGIDDAHNLLSPASKKRIPIDRGAGREDFPHVGVALHLAAIVLLISHRELLFKQIFLPEKQRTVFKQRSTA
jgi:hypothetical protein